MHKTLLAFALATVVAGAHAAPPPPPPSTPPAPAVAAAPAAPKAPVVPLLWKVSDADNSVYLLGSFHLLKADDKPITAEVEAAFADAESLVFEVPPSVLTDPATATKFQGAMMYTGGRTLSKALSADSIAQLEKVLAVSKTPIAALDPLEPWAVSLTLTVGVMHSLGFLPDQGVDKVLMQRAAGAKKPVSGLEGIDDQIKALDGTPESEQIAALDEFLKDPKTAVKELLRLHESWRAGDAETLDTAFRAEMERDMPVGYRLVNVDRNNAWVPKLDARLKAKGTDDTLAVVGALHLLGKDGLVEQLRAKGYTVERIGFNAVKGKGGSTR